MIFVTVGTHEQPFNRLVQYLDEMKRYGEILEEVIIQTGFSTYEPEFCEWSNLFPYQQMVQLVKDARIIITHGGPSSLIMALQVGKIPIVIPRQKQFHEHVNNHQVEFCNAIANRQGNLIVVEDISQLKAIIQQYNSIVKTMPTEMKCNNLLFNSGFEMLVNDLFK